MTESAESSAAPQTPQKQQRKEPFKKQATSTQQQRDADTTMPTSNRKPRSVPVTEVHGLRPGTPLRAASASPSPSYKKTDP